MATALMPGLWLLEHARGCNVYLLDAGGTLVLVDSGLAGRAHSIVREVEGLGLGRAPTLLLLTHSHGDHAGGAAALRRYFGCRVVAGAADCVIIGGRTSIEPPGLPRGLPRGLLPGGIAGARVEVDVPLSGEREVAPGVVAVPVPGHTAGSYCYVDTGRGVAFVGDLVISYPDGLARSLRMISEDDSQYLSSMSEFARHAPAAGLAGHGLPVLAGFDGMLHGLAEQPRRTLLSPSGLARRLRRLAWFAARYWRQGRA